MSPYACTRRRLLRAALALAAGGLAAACAPHPQPTEVQLPATPTPVPERPATPTPLPPTPTAQPVEAAATPTSTPEPQLTPPPPTAAYMSVARGPDAQAITEAAIAAIGGMGRFCREGYDVIIKPNICHASHGPEYASTTNPEVVGTLTRLCFEAGARRVRAMDYPFSGRPQDAYAISGIEEAVRAAGGEMEIMSALRFVDTPIPEGEDIHSWPIYQPVLETDLLINVPIAKHHSLARLTLAGKNLLGVIQNRPQMHGRLGLRIADLMTVVRPQLTVVDAVRILVAGGPTGGDLDDVRRTDTVIASHDSVAADAYATTLFDLEPDEVPATVFAAKRGLGTMDLSAIDIAEIAV